MRQLELPTTLAAKANPAFSTPSSRPQLASATVSQGVVAADSRAVTLATASEVQLQLNQDLVAATVKLDSANRRLEVLEREKDRLHKSLEEAQVGLKSHTHETAQQNLRRYGQSTVCVLCRCLHVLNRLVLSAQDLLCVSVCRRLPLTLSSGWPACQLSCPPAGHWKAACSSAWHHQYRRHSWKRWRHACR